MRFSSISLGALFLLSSSAAAAQPVVAAGPILPPAPVTFPLSSVTMEGLAYGAGEYMALTAIGGKAAVIPYDTAGNQITPTLSFVVDTGIAFSTTLAFDGTQFRVFWSDGTAAATGVRTAVVARDGTLLHVSSGVKGTPVDASVPVASACWGGECLALWASADGAIQGVRFDASGDPIDAAPVVLVAPPDAGASGPIVSIHVARVPSGYVVAWQDGFQSGESTIQAFDPSLAPLRAPVTVTATGPVVGGDGAGALVAFASGAAMRFDATGAPIDAAPFALLAGATSVTPTSSGYAVSINGGQILEIAGPGQVQAVPITVDALGPNALGGGFVASDGSDVFFVTQTGFELNFTYPAYRALVGPKANVLLPATAVATVQESESSVDVAWAGSSFLTAWLFDSNNQGLVARATVTVDGQSAALSSDAPTGLRGMALASDGTGYAVETDLWRGAQVDVAPALSGATGAPQYVPGFCQDSDGDVAIASGGPGAYLAVYSCWQGGGSQVRGLAIGAPDAGASGVTIATTNNIDGPAENSAVAWSGSTYAVSWIGIADAAQAPDASIQSFAYDAYTSFYDVTGALVAGPVSLTGGADDVGEIAVACQGGSCLFAWSSVAGIRTRVLDATTGAPAGAAATVPGTAALRSPRLAWDGREYVLAAKSPTAGPADLVAGWLDAGGALVGGGFTTIASFALGDGVPVRLASDGAGHTAVAYMRFHDAQATVYVLSPSAPAPDAGPEAGPADGGESSDAGPPSARDASPPSADATTGAAAEAGGSGGSSGCGCATAGASSSSPWAAGGLAPLWLFVRRTRRRSRRG